MKKRKCTFYFVCWNLCYYYIFLVEKYKRGGKMEYFGMEGNNITFCLGEGGGYIRGIKWNREQHKGGSIRL